MSQAKALFEFQMHAKALGNSGAADPDQLQDMCAGSSANINDESCMLGGDLCAAHSNALESSGVHEAGGEVSGRSFEDTASGRKLQRLAALAAGKDLTALLVQGRWIPQGETPPSGKHDGLGEAACRAVGKSAVCVRKCEHGAVFGEYCDGLEGIAHCCAVGPGVHGHGPADAAGDT